jgi:hypothetical protein
MRGDGALIIDTPSRRCATACGAFPERDDRAAAASTSPTGWSGSTTTRRTPCPKRVTPAQAAEPHAELYHHAVPFSRRKLLELWRRCEADPKQAQACFLARMDLKRTLGDLGE